MGIRTRLREERAQATVEMAVVTPVLLVLALIVYNVMVFASAVARFDRVVPDIVLAHAVAPSGEAMAAPSMPPRPFRLRFNMPWKAMTC